LTKQALLAVTAVCLCLSGLVAGSPAARAADDSAVASKDGKTFTLEDIDIYWLRNLGSDGLRAFFEDMVIYQEGLKLELKPTDAEINDYIQTAMGPDTYKQFTQLYSERAVRQLVEVTLVNRKYDQYLRDKIRREKSLTVTEAEAKEYFLKHIDQYHLPEGAYLSLITVEDKPKADAVLKRLKAGENFNDIAGQVNMDPKLRDAKGELGLYRKGDGWLPKPLEDAALKLQKGQYSDIIQGQYCHILFCHERAPEVSPSFDEVKDRLMQDMLEQKIEPYYNDAVNQLMSREMPRFQIQADLFRPDETDSKGAAPGGKPAPGGTAAPPARGSKAKGS
jgi:parvulin-like peptidyl-prolyl isomerase